MARLQDFSDVTPSSSSDKLLIVQSAGQGLATLDTAGQQIANNTSVSQLNTTRKTLAGAINEHDSEIGTLSALTTTDKSSLVGAVNEVNAAYPTAINNNIKRVTTAWGTSATLPVDRNHFIVLTDNRLFVVWLAGTNDIQVRYTGGNTTASGTGSAVLENVTFTRNSLRLTVTTSSSNTITIIG